MIKASEAVNVLLSISVFVFILNFCPGEVDSGILLPIVIF